MVNSICILRETFPQVIYSAEYKTYTPAKCNRKHATHQHTAQKISTPRLVLILAWSVLSAITVLNLSHSKVRNYIHSSFSVAKNTYSDLFPSQHEITTGILISAMQKYANGTESSLWQAGLLY